MATESAPADTAPVRRHRITAATLLAAAGAVAVGALGSAAPAKADEGGPWVAIAWSPDNGKHAWENNAWNQHQG